MCEREAPQEEEIRIRKELAKKPRGKKRASQTQVVHAPEEKSLPPSLFLLGNGRHKGLVELSQLGTQLRLPVGDATGHWVCSGGNNQLEFH